MSQYSPAEQLRRKSNTAAGICVIALVFLMESGFMELKRPNPASVVVLPVLGLLALGALALSVRWRRAASRLEGEPPGPGR